LLRSVGAPINMAAGEGVAEEGGELSEDKVEREPGTRDSVAFQ